MSYHATVIRDPVSGRWYAEVWDGGTGRELHVTDLASTEEGARDLADQWIGEEAARAEG